MKIRQVCTLDTVSIPASAALIEAARLMCDEHVGALVVIAAPVERPTVIGIITDRDIVRAQLERVADLSGIRVADVMTRDPLVLNEDESVENAIRHMRARGVRRAPVIGSGGTLAGLVSFDDLLLHVSDELMALAHLVGQQRAREDPVGYKIKAVPGRPQGNG